MSADDPVTVLSEDESWSLLSSMSLGRVVTILGGQPEIFPVNFVTQRRTVLFRTAQGTKLYSAVMGEGVAFEADLPRCSPHLRVERHHQGQSTCAVGQRRHLRRRGSAVAVVDCDVEASLRTGDRLGNHRAAVQVRPRTGSRNNHRLTTTARRGRENRDPVRRSARWVGFWGGDAAAYRQASSPLGI